MARVLVVDDEKVNLRLMKEMLQPLGHEVILAESGEEAIKKVQEASPDLILLDVMMPGRNGLEVTRILKEDPETRGIPIVIVTALGDIETRVEALDAGADDFLTKPVELSELRARVRSLLKVKAYYDHLRSYQKELEREVALRTNQLKMALNELKVVSLDTIYRLSMAAEYKDEDTGAHIKRMSSYSAAIAKAMGLSETVVERILLASPMHDVGKIGIPDHILLKPGKLTPEEWEIMKQHTIIGARILGGAKSGYIKLAEIIALTHHEWWDGTGYPRGLKGNQIPFVGRIVAVADAFDALTSKRPYKEALPVEEALRIVREESGSHFDPQVVDAFFSIKKEILAIKERYKDQEESLFIKMAYGSNWKK